MPEVPPLELHTILLVAAAGLFAGVQNALAGGGSFITFPTLLLIFECIVINYFGCIKRINKCIIAFIDEISVDSFY